MTKPQLLILAFSMILLSGCAAHVKTSSNQVIQDLFDKMILYPSYVPDYFPSEDEPLAEITAARIEGTLLLITINFQSGDEFALDLRHNGIYLKSKPMKMDFTPVLKVKNPGKDVVSRTIRYELEDLLPPGDEQLIVRLKGYQGDLMIVRNK
jgi:hypothetical protein